MQGSGASRGVGERARRGRRRDLPGAACGQGSVLIDAPLEKDKDEAQTEPVRPEEFEAYDTVVFKVQSIDEMSAFLRGTR